MISAAGISTAHSTLACSYKAGVSAMDASLNEGKSQGMDRAVQRERALKQAEAVVASSLADTQSLGPALEAARDKALGRGIYGEQSLIAQFLVLASSHAPGPKSVSSMMAEENFRAARSQAVAAVGGATL